MRASSENYDPNAHGQDALDIRTRVLLSLLVSGVSIYLSGTGPLLALGGLSLVYLLCSTRRYRVVAVAYLAVAAMMALTVGIIWGSFRIGEALVAGTAWEASVAQLKPAMLGNFHTPFLRMVPALNVLLAIGLRFSVQRFVGAMKSVRLPRVLFLPLMVFCRFVPEFVDVIRQLRDAVRMRGFSISFGAALLHPLQTLRLTAVPLVVRTLRMADHLAVAAEMKRVGYARRPSQLRALAFGRWDAATLAAAVVLLGALAAWQAHIPATPYGPAAVAEAPAEKGGAHE